MAENNNMDQFDHPIKKNNWWLYIFGTLVLIGIIIWFFVDWSYKDRNREPEPVEQLQEAPIQDQSQQETLPNVTVEGEEGGQQ